MTVIWRTEPSEAGISAFLEGIIDEDSDLAPLVETIEKDEVQNLILNLSGVRRINSFGVREWVNFIREISGKTKTTLCACSPAMVAQLNMVGNFAGNATIESIQLPFVCDECGQEVEILAKLAGRETPTLPSPLCPSCSSAMEFDDDLEEAYFGFI